MEKEEIKKNATEYELYNLLKERILSIREIAQLIQRVLHRSELNSLIKELKK